VKLATFNINNVNKRLPNLLRWLKQSKPDIVRLQELKCEARDFPETDLRRAGYSAVWEGQKFWNGVAVLSRGTMPIVTRRRLPGDPSDHQARYIEAAVEGLLIACLYLPNGNPQPGLKFDYKMKWFSRLARHAARLQMQGHPAVLVGDYNVAPTDIDIYPTTSWSKDASFSPRPARPSPRSSQRAGLMLSGISSVTSAFIPSGPTGVIVMRRITAFGSTISF
jgi:exodeoxyribonuclease-3